MYCAFCKKHASYFITNKYYTLKYYACATHVDHVVDTIFGLKHTIRITHIDYKYEHPCLTK